MMKQQQRLVPRRPDIEGGGVHDGLMCGDVMREVQSAEWSCTKVPSRPIVLGNQPGGGFRTSLIAKLERRGLKDRCDPLQWVYYDSDCLLCACAGRVGGM